MKTNIISLKNVKVKFNLGIEKILGLKEYLIRFIKKELMFQEFWALKGIDLEISKGEVFGIVGLNGAGKSTLLKVIAGVLKPTFGEVFVNGKIAPLIELGAGFDMELTARENIYLNGAILGYSKKFIDEKFDEVVNFAEINDFLDVPLKNYSSGMVARIAFAIATITEPDILIVDEILSVGDFKFQKKCEEKIDNMIKNGVSVIMVSHSLDQIKNMCQRVAWLKGGEIVMIGETKKVLEAYEKN